MSYEYTWEVWNLTTRDAGGWTHDSTLMEGACGRTRLIAEYAQAKGLTDGEHTLAIRTEEGALSVVTIRVTTAAVITEIIDRHTC